MMDSGSEISFIADPYKVCVQTSLTDLTETNSAYVNMTLKL